jgi:hypothetical protein
MSEVPLHRQPSEETLAYNAAGTIRLGREAIYPEQMFAGETEIVLQRHGKYIRETGNPSAGWLTPQGILQQLDISQTYFSQLLRQVPEDEQDNVHALFVTSDTNYAGIGQRSYQTTEIAQLAAERIFQRRGLWLPNILNISPDSTSQGNPRIMPALREPQMFEQSPEFVDFLRNKYGDLSLGFWKAFEEDTERKTRQRLHAEGPDEIADRMRLALGALVHYSENFHDQTPDSRLIIWAGTHHDTISTFIKREVLRKNKSVPVMTDYCGGAVIKIDQKGKATTRIAGGQYGVML